MFDSFVIDLIVVFLCALPTMALVLVVVNFVVDRTNRSTEEAFHTKRRYLEKVSQLVNLDFLAGTAVFPFSDYQLSLTFLHKTPTPMVSNRLIGWRGKCEVQLFEFEYYKPSQDSRDNPIWKQHLVLILQNNTFNLPQFQVRAKTWADGWQENGFIVGNKYIWGEETGRLRAVFDWEIIQACEPYADLHVTGVHRHLVLAWPMKPQTPFRWPEKEKVIDFVALGERIAARAIDS